MYSSERLNSTIPSPSLHLLGSDAGLRAQLPIILSTPSDDGKYHLYTRPAPPPVPTLSNRDKGLPDIPPHVQALAKLEGSSIPSSFFASSKPRIQLKPVTGVTARGYTKSPVRKVFNANGTARKLLGAPQQKDSNANKSDISLPLPKSDLFDVLDISPAASTDTLPLSLHLASSSSSSTTGSSSSSSLAVPPSTPPPRSASSRKGPPAPIRIPNGRIHAPAIIVERDADLADLESRISVGIRTPKIPRRSTRRKRRDMAAKVEPPKITMPAPTTTTTSSYIPPILTASTTTASIRTSVATSITTTDSGDGNMTETSNDEFRFSLGFLMQPERQSVMTHRTGRADSATLPELSPFLASESYVPPVPSIPPSLLASNKSSDATPQGLGGSPLRRNSSIGDISSPLASAYSQLTANARKYRDTKLTDFSPTFTAASPLESPERFILPTIRPLAKRNQKSNNNGSGNGSEAVVDSRREGAQREEESSSGSENRTGSVPGSAQASPLARRVLTNTTTNIISHTNASDANNVFRKDSLTDGTKSPGSGSMYSSLDTPDLSPRNGAKRSNNNTSTESSTPESFEIINPIRHLEKQQQPARSDSPYSFSTTSSQRRHRELPKSAVPMSAVSPQSTSSIDHYLDSISFSNNSGSISAEPLERWPVGPSPPPSENPFSASAMEAFRKAHQGVSTFAPSHMPASAPGPAGPETTTTTATAATKVAPKKLVFPPLKVEEKQESMKEVKILTASIRERRNSMPSPSGLSPDLMNRRPSAPSPLTGGPSTILFTPSAHQPLHAALSSYSSSTGFPTGRPRALDDSNIRGSNLSIKTDHIRTAPRRGLVPYTPFSQGSDSFSPATALLTGAKSSKMMPLTGLKTSMVPNSALSTSVSVKLATRARTRPPSGPRKPRHSNSTKSKDKIPMIPMIEESVLSTSRSRSVSESQTVTRASMSPYPPTPTFETQLVRFKGLTLDVAKWTFSQEELQEVTRRAICHSSDPMSIRLLPAKILDEDIPAELERLVLQREELKANYKYQYRRRMGVLKSLSAMSEHPEGTMNGSVAARLVEDLMDIGIKSDQIGEEMYVVSDQIAQLRALQESHSASALAMALRKINSSFIKVQAEVADLKSQVADVTAEREDAWAMADTLEKELNEIKALLEKETASKKEQMLSPPIRRLRKGVVPANISTGAAPIDEPSPLKSSGSRVTAARNVSIRRSKASLRSRYSMTSPQPLSALHTSGSIHSSYYGSQASASLIPPVPPLNSALASAAIHTASVISSAVPSAGPTSATRMPKRHSTALSRRSSSFSGTPHSSSRALLDAQNDLLKILGVPVKGMSEGGFRRTRSFSDAGLRASMLPDSPPAAAAIGRESTFGGLAVPQGANSRESRITSFYGAYLSRSNTVAGNRMTVRRQTGASQWDMEAIYDGILDDPDTLFAVVRPGL